MLFETIQELYPQNLDIHLNYPHPILKFEKSGRKMEFDVYIPSKKLAFEYQGIQHKENKSYIFQPAETIQVSNSTK